MINVMTAGLQEQEINVMQSWLDILKLFQDRLLNCKQTLCD